MCAMLGIEFHPDHAGFGETVPQAPRDLAAKIEKRDITVWVRRPAKQYREEGVRKAACPECGAVTEFTEFAEMMAFVCDQCGAGVDVEGEPDPDA